MTKASGEYLFDNLTPGNYFVEFTPLSGYIFSPKDNGNDAKDSDANTSSGRTIVTTLDPGEDDLTWDAGMYQTTLDLASIGDYVWEDTNQDGIQDGTEVGVSNVTVNLYKIEFVDSFIYNQCIQASSDDAHEDISKGDMKLTDIDVKYGKEDPAGLRFTSLNIPNDAIINNAFMYWDNGEGGKADVTSIDIFAHDIANPGTFSSSKADISVRPITSSFVKMDVNLSGGETNIQTPNLSHVIQELVDSYNGINDIAFILKPNTDSNDEAKILSFDDDPNNAPCLYVDYLIPGPGGETFVGTTTTSGAGYYSFTNLIPGNYSVEFILPSGYTFSPQDRGSNDAKDSDANTSTGRAMWTTLDPGESDMTWDAGIYKWKPPCSDGSIGDYVWYDEDYNGLQDDNFPSDPSHGINNVTMNLYDGGGAFLKTTTTNSAGWYMFTDLVAGDYFVEVDPSTLPKEFKYDPRGWKGVFQTYDYDGIDTPNIAAVTLDFDCGSIIEDCCDYGKPQKITMRYTGEDCSASHDTQDSGKSGCTGDPAFYPDVYIISNDDSNPSAGNIWFSGPVTLNGNYVIDATLAGETKLKVNTYVHVFKKVGGSLVLLQTVYFHTSCSQTLSDGDQWGANKLMSILFEGGEVCIDGEKENLDVDFGYSDIPLPVTLSSFTVTYNGGNVEINWVTESEIDNQGFLLERRIFESGDDWHEIASYLTSENLQGQGSVTHSTNYEYMDQLVQVGLTYEYRLGDIDYDGIVEYHSTRTVTVSENDESTIPKQFTLKPAYPNPFNPSTTIEYAIPKDGMVSITIYDLTGQRVSRLLNTEQMAGWHKIRWNGNSDNGIQMPAGIYLVTVNTGNSLKTMKLVFVK